MKEVLSTESTFRKSEPDTFNDKVFMSEMNLKIHETGDNYNRMLYKEALRTGFYELQAARDKYLQLSALDGINWSLIMQYIELQTILIGPICPHVAEHVLGIIGKGSIHDARWPQVGAIDETSINSSQYLMDAAHSFRIMLKGHCTPKKSSKGKTDVTPVVKPTSGIIWVAKTFPTWQSIVLTTMKDLWTTKALPENKIIAGELGKKNELKKYMKRVMPFVQMTREKVDVSGVTALNLILEFNEVDVLEGNKNYLKSTLELDDIVIKFSDEAPEKIKEECCPGSPFINFS